MTIEFLLDTWKFFRTHILVFAWIILPFSIPLEILSTVYHQTFDYGDSFLLAALPEFLYIAIYPVFGAAVVFYMASVLKGQRLSVNEAWNLGVQNWGSYLMLTLILVVVVGIGFAFLILPGILLMAKLAFSEFELLLQRKNPLDSLQASWQDTTEYFWMLLTGGLVITGIIYLPIWSINHLVSESGFYPSLVGSLLRVAESVVMVAYTIFAFRVYDYASEKV
ncbi:hypothetical protein [Marinobacter sp. CHS3-4]|uniref:hypothetical protein n=1 Tax=Marinobacter sp. CHS3-4 TaxID=3045174 RepID=UPI0024B53DAC|nr:hypothetical protein [Marinobacter sp. CHS3-4]MDI9244267.1 hypothetical protein [Marinobacter sp. CHS3-4]